MNRSFQHPKIQASHLQRQAIVYVRQSSTQQVRGNRESTARQYALVERAMGLGWSTKSVHTIDEDQGRSGATAIHRHGFKKLLAEIGAGQVGIVLALEASRLARSSADWHRLVEICVVTQTLLADETAVYDPRDPNDRLLLGVKGTISEAELFTLQCRLREGRWNKAKRGEYARALPVGYVRTESGAIVKDPDRQVQARIEYIFRLFARHKVARQVVARLMQEKLQVPVKVWGGPRHGAVIWKTPNLSYVIRMLHNPTYAGAYAYGQSQYDVFDRSPTSGRAKQQRRPVEDWPICLRGVHPAYITWDQFTQTLQILRSNAYHSDSQGAPRQGRALLQGIAFCGRCGGRMGTIHYSQKDRKHTSAYRCFDAYRHHCQPLCQSMSAEGVDEAVTNLFLEAVSSAKVEIALHALEELDADRNEALKQWDLQLQRADYEVELAQRRYESADPTNRLVAGELEARWEQSLRQREQVRHDREDFERRKVQPLTEIDRRRIRELSSDLGQVWHAETTSMENRKALLRFLVNRVHLDGVTEPCKIRIDVEWQTGTHTTLTIDRPGYGPSGTPVAVIDRIRELFMEHDYAEVAAMLNKEGFRTAYGKLFQKGIVSHIVRKRIMCSKRGKLQKEDKP